MLRTAAQQNKSAIKKRYRMLNPFDATKKAITDKKITICIEILLWLFFNLIILSKSTIIKLEIAFIKVSILPVSYTHLTLPTIFRV